MMDWAKQSEEMMKAWTETQKKMWDNWMAAMQQPTGQTQAAEMWQKTVETWEKSVNSTLDAQAEWTKIWADSLDVKPDIPKELTEWAKQAQDMAKSWGETQRQMWQGWFDLVKTAEPPKMAQTWGEEGQKAFTAWQESAQKMMDAQTQWASKWTAEATKEK
jgi:hypothetical protein